MNIKNNGWLLLFFWIFFGTSCYEDKGNYDYQPANQTSALDGFAKDYKLAVGDILEIIPTILNSGDVLGDTARYDYWWTAQRSLHREGENNQQYVIGRGPSLFYQIDLPNISPDDYLIVFHMKDRKTQIEWTHARTLAITGSLQEGWLLLSDKGGNAELNMYARKSDGKVVLVKDLLEKSGFPYLRGPRQITYENNFTSSDGNKIWILTDEATGWLTKTDYQWRDDQLIKYKMVNPVGNNHVNADIKQYQSLIVLFDDKSVGGFQARDYRNLGSIFGGNIAVYNKGEISFKVEPYVGGSYSNPMINAALLYDSDNQQFVWCPVVGNSTPEESVKLSGDTRWKVGKKMIYMQSVVKSGRIYALFEDPDVADAVWEYDMEIESRFDPASMGFVASPVIRGVRKLENASHLRQAKFIVYHMNDAYLYYTHDKTLYTHYNGDERPLKIYDDEITVLHTQYVGSGETQNMNYLLLGTYKEDPEAAQANLGDLYFFSTDASNPINLTQRNKVSGVGKVVDIDYQLK